MYFVTACTASRRAFLANSVVHQVFINFAMSGNERGAWVGRYVLMPDHVHLFVAFDDEKISLQTWMKSLKNALSKTLREMNAQSPHWQKGFFDHVLRGGESYSEKWEYVFQNPVRAGLVARLRKIGRTRAMIFPLDVRRS